MRKAETSIANGATKSSWKLAADKSKAKYHVEVDEVFERYIVDSATLSNDAFLNMWGLGGASKAALAYARAWVWPVCEAFQTPAGPHVAIATSWPYGFHEAVVADQKFMRESTQKQWVALGRRGDLAHSSAS